MEVSGFKTIDRAFAEITVARSKFLAFAHRVKSGDEAEEILNSLKKKYNDATHVCYAYISDILGNATRFSDAGEPNGTAGKPLLDVITKSNLRQTLLAVVRYFGGVKLGTGGLARAYREAGEAAINLANEEFYSLSSIYKITLIHSDYSKIQEKLNVIKTEFDQNVTVFAAEKQGENLAARIMEHTCGRAKIEFIKTDYIKS